MVLLWICLLSVWACVMRFKRLLYVWLSLMVCALVMVLFGAVCASYGVSGGSADVD